MQIIGMENVTDTRKHWLDNASEYRVSWLDGEQVIQGSKFMDWGRVCRIGMVRSGKGSVEIEVRDGQLLYAMAYISKVTSPSILKLARLGELVFSIEVAFADTEC